MLVSGVVPNLVNGVSRQPEGVRLNSQLQEQINGMSTVVKGLQNRPGTQHNATIPGSWGNILAHPINRDTTERYWAILRNGAINVYTIDGAPKAVAAPDGLTYLNISGAPEDSFSLVTNADYTFIANNEVVPAMDPASATETRGEEAMIFFRAVNYSRRYKIWINDVLCANVRTPDGRATDPGDITREEEATQASNVARMMIWGSFIAGDTLNAAQLANGWVSAQADGYDDGMYEAGAAYVTDHQGQIDLILTEVLDDTNWTIQQYGSSIYIKNNLGNTFDVRVEVDSDVQNKQAIYIIQKVSSDFSDLPPFAPQGYVVKILNTEDSDKDDYYVKFVKDNDDDSNLNGTWEECPGPGATTAFDYSTMPHVLVREASGNFTFRRATSAEWTPRRCGDEDQDSGPSFLGQGIQGMFFARGRLGFLAGENIILSRSNSFFDFWRQTMIKVVDDDPVDLAANEGPIANNKIGFSWKNNIGLVSAQAIQVVSGGELLSPASAKIDMAFEEGFLPNVAPVRTTRTMLFASSSNRYGDVREAYVGDDPDNQVIGSVADHIPGYLPPDIRQMVGNAKENMMFMRGGIIARDLYVYQWYWERDQKAQSAWHKWSLDPSAIIEGMAMFDDQLHLVVRRSTALYFEFVNISQEITEDSGSWNIRLDRKVNLMAGTGVYDAGTDTTSFATGRLLTGDEKVVQNNGVGHGVPAEVTGTAGSTITVKGDWSGVSVIVGNPFSFEFTLNRQYFTVAGNGAFKALERQRLQILRHVYQVDNTAYFRVEVTPYTGASARTVEYSALQSGDAASLLDSVNLLDNAVRVPINAKSDRAVVRVVNDTHYPCAFLGVEWEGLYQDRGKRVA